MLVVATLGWLFAGMLMSIGPLASRSATLDLLGPGGEGELGKWFAWYNCAFLLGAAAGGLIFGWLGDRCGRSKALGWSILCYSTLTGASAFARAPEQLLVLRFLSCLGVGGVWPNGVALVSEAWPGASRPKIAGLIGAANIGQVLLGLAACQVAITPTSWRWVMGPGAAPVLLGLYSLAWAPESPRWLLARQEAQTTTPPRAEVFRPPLLWVTILGVILGTIPVFGGWGSGNWLTAWADKVGGSSDPHLKAWAVVERSFGGTIGGLLGGWLASRLGRRFSYFLISAGALALSAYIFRALTPFDTSFGSWVFVLGVVSGLYFGWLPLCLPDLFPTRVRSTGAGVTFNFGRIAAAAGVLGAGDLIQRFDGDYGRVGAITSLIYAVGLLAIWLAPRNAPAAPPDASS